jgi:hypothetical protein
LMLLLLLLLLLFICRDPSLLEVLRG